MIQSKIHSCNQLFPPHHKASLMYYEKKVKTILVRHSTIISNMNNHHSLQLTDTKMGDNDI